MEQKQRSTSVNFQNKPKVTKPIWETLKCDSCKLTFSSKISEGYQHSICWNTKTTVFKISLENICYTYRKRKCRQAFTSENALLENTKKTVIKELKTGQYLLDNRNTPLSKINSSPLSKIFYISTGSHWNIKIIYVLLVN